MSTNRQFDLDTYLERHQMSEATREQLRNDDRKRLAITKPRYRHVPKYILHRVRAAVKAGKLPKPRRGLTGNRNALEHACDTVGREWLDHWGSIEMDGERIFVSEPYPMNYGTETFQQALLFADLLGLEFRVETSWHYPGDAIRFVLSPFEWQQRFMSETARRLLNADLRHVARNQQGKR